MIGATLRPEKFLKQLIKLTIMKTIKKNTNSAMYLRLKIFCCILLLSSCNLNNFDNLLKPISPRYALSLANLEIEDSLKILLPEGSYNFYHNTQILDDSIFYGINVFSPLRIDVIDLKAKEYSKFITFDKNIFKAYEVNQFRVLSEDSIFVSAYPNKCLYLVNDNSEIIKSWSKIDLDISSDIDIDLYNGGFAIADLSGLENFEIIGDSCYITLSPVSAKDFEGSPSVKRHGIYDLKDKCWRSVFAPYEGVLKHKGSSVYFYDMHKPYRKVCMDKIYVSYPVDHNVYVYDFKTQELLFSKPISPSFAVDFLTPLPFSSKDDDALLNQLRKRTPFYGPLYYHQEIGCWSRFYNFFDSGVFKRGIVVYNEAFEIILEKVFLEKEFKNITPCGDGFILMPENLDYDDCAMFIKYKIKI